MVLLDWPPPDHLWIGRRSRQFAPSQRLTNVPELRTPNATAQTRTVSGGAFWPSRGESSRHFKYMAAHGYLSSSPSLSGRVGVKRFQTAPSIWCGMFTRRVLASLRDRHLGPPMMGSGGCGGPISRRVLAVKTYGRHKDSKRTRLIHRPCGDIAPPVGGIRVFSPVVFLLCTTRCEIHERHKCALTARALLFAWSR